MPHSVSLKYNTHTGCNIRDEDVTVCFSCKYTLAGNPVKVYLSIFFFWRMNLKEFPRTEYLGYNNMQMRVNISRGLQRRGGEAELRIIYPTA